MIPIVGNNKNKNQQDNNSKRKSTLFLKIKINHQPAFLLFLFNPATIRKELSKKKEKLLGITMIIEAPTPTNYLNLKSMQKQKKQEVIILKHNLFNKKAKEFQVNKT